MSNVSNLWLLKTWIISKFSPWVRPIFPSINIRWFSIVGILITPTFRFVVEFSISYSNGIQRTNMTTWRKIIFDFFLLFIRVRCWKWKKLKNYVAYIIDLGENSTLSRVSLFENFSALKQSDKNVLIRFSYFFLSNTLEDAVIFKRIYNSRFCFVFIVWHDTGDVLVLTSNITVFLFFVQEESDYSDTESNDAGGSVDSSNRSGSSLKRRKYDDPYRSINSMVSFYL